MYFPRNWEFDSVLSKLQNFGTPLTAQISTSLLWVSHFYIMLEYEANSREELLQFVPQGNPEGWRG
jgi:hypothetical protein